MRRLLPHRSVLVLVDVQDRVFRTLPEDQRRAALDHLSSLRQVAQRLEVPTLACELDPRSHGRTIPQLGGLPVLEHAWLSAARNTELLPRLGVRDQVVLTGLETHLAVVQTGLDLLDAGLAVWVVVDACLDRQPAQAEVALRRLEQAGARPISAEGVMFEWVDHVHDPLHQELLRSHHR